MKKLQSQVFEQTEKLVAKFNLLRVVTLALISALIIIIFLFAFMGTVEWMYWLLVIGVSFLYSLFRDYFVTKYSKRVMHTYHAYMLEKKPRIETYIPMFSKTSQGMILKKAALYFDNGELYMEAFNQYKSGNKPQESITIKAGKDLVLDAYQIEKQSRYVTYTATLMETDYNFSIVYIKELIDRIEETKKGAKS
ncbi:MAG: hypothetical protein JXB08_03395 [Bacilli bacterium]|nr:hypothetical protein [Bacilli bacterium]MBN2877109.1 hypothetical protein [Bacilli bacterium]